MFITCPGSYLTFFSIASLISRFLLSFEYLWRSPLQREGTPMAPKPQCKSSGPKRLISKRRTQPLKENFPAPPLTFPCQILIGQVVYLSLSVYLNPPSGRYFSFSFLLFFFFSVFSSLSILVSRAGPAGSHRVVPMVIGEEIASRMEDDWDGGVGLFDRDRERQLCTER